MTDTPEPDSQVWRKRLRFRAWHRGTRETDLIFGPFADECLPVLSAQDLDDFEALLGVPDPDLYNWVLGQAVPPEDFRTPVLDRIRAFALSRTSR